MNDQGTAKMQSHLFILAFLLIFTEYASTADLDPSLSRHLRDVNEAADLTPSILHVASKISSRFANTVVTSTLKNKSLKTREAKFVVYLPGTAFVSNFSMIVNGKQYIALVKEREDPNDDFEKANYKKKGQTTERVQAMRIRGMDMFAIAISVAPNSSAEFCLSYQQLLRRRNGFYDHVISIRPKEIVPLLKVVVDIEEPQALRYVDVMKIRKSPSDALVKGNPLAVVTYKSPTSIHIEYSPSEDEQINQGSMGVDGDLIIRYDVHHGNDAGIVQVLGSYFVQYFSPSGLKPLPKYVAFVIDVSGSMSGQIRQAMVTILKKAREGDYFLISLAGCVRMGGGSTYGIDIEKVKKYLDKCVRSTWKGKKDFLDSLQTELSTLWLDISWNYRKILSGVFPVVLVLTDADPAPRETDPKTIRANLRRRNKANASIFSLGLGDNFNMDFLTALSVESGGNAYRIYPGKDVISQVVGYFNQISTPMLQRMTFDYPKDMVDDSKTTARTFAQYLKGSELVLSGKIREGVTSSSVMSVNVRGNTSNSSVTYTVSRTLRNLTVPSDKVLIEDFTERLWAYMKIKQLLDNLLITYDSKENDRLKNEALQLSLQYNFVTPLTSLVVTQKESENADVFIFPRLKDVHGQSASIGWRLASTGAPILWLIVTYLRFLIF